MKQRTLVVALLVALLPFGAAASEASNSSPPARAIPARSLPVPATVSPQMQAIIAQPPGTAVIPETADGWKALVAAASRGDLERIAVLRKQFDVTVEQVVVDKVPCYLITPARVPEKSKDRLLVHLHGGGYVFGPGEAGILEAILMAGVSHMKVLSVDYRMPPEHPYPAAMDDATAVWREVVKRTSPRNLAVFGTSTGGAMTLALVQRAQREGLPLPAAIAPGTPWSDLTKTGDSYFTNERVDNVLGAYEPLLSAAARLYANGLDLKDPRLSPVYGSFKGFPPTILTTGTRDLFLSNSVRVYRLLRAERVEAQLELYEGQSHAQYLADANAPEFAQALGEITRFFDSHLGRRKSH